MKKPIIQISCGAASVRDKAGNHIYFREIPYIIVNYEPRRKSKLQVVSNA